MECPDHHVPMSEVEGRLICPEPGCPRFAAIPHTGEPAKPGDPSSASQLPPESHNAE